MTPYIGMTVRLSAEALDNYGWGFLNLLLKVTWIANHSVPTKEFYDPKSPRYHEENGHPGYDEGVSPMWLVDVEGEGFNQAVYEWEVVEVKG